MPLQAPLRKFSAENEAALEAVIQSVIDAKGSIATFKRNTSKNIRNSMVGQPLYRIEETVNQSLRKIDGLVNKIKSKQEQQEQEGES